MTRPLVFIGSSSEGKDAAEAIKANLEEISDVEPWHQLRPEPGESILEHLYKNLERYDFAVLVASPDDKVESRGETKLAPRDNILVELGMFMGRIGRDRTFLCCEEAIKLPSDLKGVTHATYRLPRDSAGWQAAVGTASKQIKAAIEKRGRRTRSSRRLRMAYHASVYDSAHGLGLDEPNGLSTPQIRNPGGLECCLDYSRYHFVRCSLSYSRVQEPQEGSFYVALAMESARLSAWLRDHSVIYRELMPLDEEDVRWWGLLLNDLRKAGLGNSTIESQLALIGEVARFGVRIDGRVIVPNEVRVSEDHGGFQIGYPWPRLTPDDTPTDFEFTYVGLQAKAQSWFPLLISEPSENVDLSFNYALNGTIREIKDFEFFDSEGEPSVVRDPKARKFSVHTNRAWIRSGGALVYWHP